MARGFLKKSGEGPSIRTITSASAREYTREFLSPSEMQPYEVAEILGSDIDSGLTKSGVARARRKYGGNIIREELSLSFGQSLKKQLLGIHGLLVLLCAVILYIFTPDPLYMLLAVCAAAVTLVNAYLESRSQRAIKSTLRRRRPRPSSSATAANSRWTAARSSRATSSGWRSGASSPRMRGSSNPTG